MYQDYIDACSKDGQKIERLIRTFYRTQPRRSVFIDGGAHNGYHTNFAARHFSGRVIGVEASPVIYVELVKQKMKAAVNANECEIFPINAALGCREKQGDTAQFFYSPTHPGRSTVNTKMWEQWGKGNVKYEAPIMAPIVEIDDLTRLFGGGKDIDFIKLDLEGNEINALRGAHKTLMTHRPNVVMEFGLKLHNQHLFGETLQEFRAFLQTWGYRAFAPWAEDVTETLTSSVYPFWYLFLLPEGPDQRMHCANLVSAFSESVAE